MKLLVLLNERPLGHIFRHIFMMRLKKFVPIIISFIGAFFVFLNYQRETTQETENTQLSRPIHRQRHITPLLTRYHSLPESSETQGDDVINSSQSDHHSSSVAVDDSKELHVENHENTKNSSNVVMHAEEEYDFDKVQRQRKAHVNAACKRLNLTRSLPDVNWATTVHFIINDKFKFLFNFVPKIACTTWKGIMIELYHNQVGQTKKRFVKMDEIKSPAEVKRRWRDYKKVTFVREPLARVLSAYLNKFRNGDKKSRWERRFGAQITKVARKGVKLQPGQRANKDFTFVEFIKFIIHLGPNVKMDQNKDHWLPYNTWTLPCRLQYDYIGHYETLAYDGPTIIQRLGVELVVQFPEVHGSAAAEKLHREYAQVSVDLIVKLQQFYHMDYELFGYSKEESMKTVLGNRTSSD